MTQHRSRLLSAVITALLLIPALLPASAFAEAADNAQQYIPFSEQNGWEFSGPEKQQSVFDVRFSINGVTMDSSSATISVPVVTRTEPDVEGMVEYNISYRISCRYHATFPASWPAWSYASSTVCPSLIDSYTGTVIIAGGCAVCDEIRNQIALTAGDKEVPLDVTITTDYVSDDESNGLLGKSSYAPFQWNVSCTTDITARAPEAYDGLVLAYITDLDRLHQYNQTYLDSYNFSTGKSDDALLVGKGTDESLPAYFERYGFDEDKCIFVRIDDILNANRSAEDTPANGTPLWSSPEEVDLNEVFAAHSIKALIDQYGGFEKKSTAMWYEKSTGNYNSTWGADVFYFEETEYWDTPEYVYYESGSSNQIYLKLYDASLFKGEPCALWKATDIGVTQKYPKTAAELDEELNNSFLPFTGNCVATETEVIDGKYRISFEILDEGDEVSHSQFSDCSVVIDPLTGLIQSIEYHENGTDKSAYDFDRSFDVYYGIDEKPDYYWLLKELPI